MKSLLKKIVFCLVFLAPTVLFGQGAGANAQQDEKIQDEKKAAPGTYQFIVSLPDTQFIFTNDILIQIEGLRKEKEEVIYSINSTVKVRILSTSEIMKPGFKPLTEIVYKEQ